MTPTGRHGSHPRKVGVAEGSQRSFPGAEPGCCELGEGGAAWASAGEGDVRDH